MIKILYMDKTIELLLDLSFLMSLCENLGTCKIYWLVHEYLLVAILIYYPQNCQYTDIIILL